jgi:Predicted membrane protein
MIALEVFGESGLVELVAKKLDQTDGVSRVTCIGATRAGHALVSATVRPPAVDALLDALRGLGVADADVTLTRMEVVGALAQGRTGGTMVWADVMGTAWLNARPLARYVAFMIVAGVIACYGVIDNNGILIVGAMAVSPDLLPITAIAVGIVGRQAQLAGRALLTLALGMTAAGLAAAVSTFIQHQFGFIPSGYSIQATGVLTGLTTISNETLVVAFVAGIAGMLALETRASSGVGVAISVTTIPAVGYLGVAVGLGEITKAAGTLGVLGANVIMMVVGAVGTLLLQRAFLRSATTKRNRTRLH